MLLPHIQFIYANGMVQNNFELWYHIHSSISSGIWDYEWHFNTIVLSLKPYYVTSIQYFMK